MNVRGGRKILIIGAIFLGGWLVMDLIYAGFVVQRVVEVSRELVARHQELVRMWGWEEILK